MKHRVTVHTLQIRWAALFQMHQWHNTSHLEGISWPHHSSDFSSKSPSLLIPRNPSMWTKCGSIHTRLTYRSDRMSQFSVYSNYNYTYYYCLILTFATMLSFWEIFGSCSVPTCRHIQYEIQEYEVNVKDLLLLINCNVKSEVKNKYSRCNINCACICNVKCHNGCMEANIPGAAEVS
jgi:hypothetical protein